MGNEADEDEVCGETYDHLERDLGNGGWECTRCGAEGQREPDDEE